MVAFLALAALTEREISSISRAELGKLKTAIELHQRLKKQSFLVATISSSARGNFRTLLSTWVTVSVSTQSFGVFKHTSLSIVFRSLGPSSKPITFI